jgi:hypothetical protein
VEPFWSGQPTYAPIYASDVESYQKIEVQPAKAIVSPDKIFTYNQYLMINIIDEGFHVVDNSNPSIPRNLFFVNVPGNKDVAIKDGLIYADNYADIIAFTINENQQLEVVERLENVMNNQEYPPFRGVYFECVDPDKGLVIGWEEKELEDPKCFRP